MLQNPELPRPADDPRRREREELCRLSRREYARKQTALLLLFLMVGLVVAALVKSVLYG